MNLDLSSIDLSSLSPARFALLAAVLAMADWAWGVLQAIRAPNVFSWDKVAGYLTNHVLFRVIPIYALAAISQTFPEGDAGRAVFYTAAAASLLLYLAETVKSFVTTKQVADALAQTPPATQAAIEQGGLSSGPIPADAGFAASTVDPASLDAPEDPTVGVPQ